MMYLVKQNYDNGEFYEDLFEKDDLVGVFETEELAKKEIELLISEREKKFNERIGKRGRKYVSFEKTDAGYQVVSFAPFRDVSIVETYTYSIIPVELNKRADVPNYNG